MKIEVTQISEEWRGAFFFGKLRLFPFGVFYDWAQKDKK